jgi:hypothetical protein
MSPLWLLASRPRTHLPINLLCPDLRAPREVRKDVR